jgi:GNAT superfamily N-acetyltransferase
MGSNVDPVMPPSIRPADVGDVDELTRLRWTFRVEAGTPASLDRDAFGADMRDFVTDAFSVGSDWRAWAAEADGRLVGCVWLRLVERVPHPNLPRGARPIAYLTNMYVEPELRDAGLGRRLLEVALDAARSDEVDGVVLWPSDRSRPFYERAGFRGLPDGPMWLELAGD